MMRTFSTVAVSFLVLTASQALAVNLLQNPTLDFDGGVATGAESATADFWTRTGFTDTGNPDPETTSLFQPWASYNTDPGARGLWFKPFLGGALWWSNPPSPVDSDLYQDVPGVAGVTYTLSAWFKYERYYSGLNPLQPTQTLLAIDYFDASMTLLDSNVLDIDEVMPTLPDGTGSGQWHQFSVSGVAPAGTAFVRARASMIDGVFSYRINPDGSWSALNPQSAFVDEFVLTPEPATGLALLALLVLRRR